MSTIAICLIVLVIRILYTLDFYFYRAPLDSSPRNYYVLTSQCRIPYVEPFSADILMLFNPKNFKYENCSEEDSLVTLLYQADNRQYSLHMNMSAVGDITRAAGVKITDLHCCYREVRRSNGYEKINGGYDLLSCIEFYQQFLVPKEIDFLITECYIGNYTINPIQKDAFTFIQHRTLNGTVENSTNTNTSPRMLKRKPSVLLLGIDSLSRINLRRTMPRTFMYLQTNRWYELQGYNKVDDNTFPNLLALLTSYNLSTVKIKCQVDIRGGFNQRACNLIWNNFKDYGYRTAYAEDVQAMSTFNYEKLGFVEQPTDYYLRPFIVCVENYLRVQKKGGLPYCVGRKHNAEYIYDYAFQLSHAHPNEPVFGLFWTNSFSHNFFDTPATMDMKIFEYLERMKRDGVFGRSIVLFFSDHGIRWGPLLKLKSGFFEERLPTMFLSLPRWYQEEHADYIKALKINRHRLTSPYDIYATLKHILEDIDPDKEFPYLNDTTKGISVFREIPENRTCNQAGITDHWCTCVAYKILSTGDKIVKHVAKLLVAEMNKYLVSKKLNTKCAALTLNGIYQALVKTDADNKNLNDHTYRLWYMVNPGYMVFQGTFVFNSVLNSVKVNVEDISRLDSYERTANCTVEKQARKYCMCRK